jgi:hypothetical protein
MNKCSSKLPSKDPPNKSKPQPRILSKRSIPNECHYTFNQPSNKPFQKRRMRIFMFRNNISKSNMISGIIMICKHKFRDSKRSRISTKNKRTPFKNLPKPSKLSKVTVSIIQVKTEASNSKNSPIEKTLRLNLASMKSQETTKLTKSSQAKESSTKTLSSATFSAET